MPTALAVSLMLFAGSSHGLGFGPPRATAVIGSALDFVLPLQVHAGETFDPACVQVEVQVGDRRLPPYAVRWQLVPGARADEPQVQVSTLAVLDEPVVSVLVSSGCRSRVSRRINLLAQLPALATTPAAPASMDQPPVAHHAPVGAARPLRSAQAARPRNQDGLRLDRLLPTAAGATATATAVVALAKPLPLPSNVMAAPGAMALGVQAALADAAAVAATEQIRSLEQQVQQVLTEAKRQQDQLTQLRQRLSAAESVNAWLPWLLLGLVVSGSLAVWLGLRVRRLQRELEQRHWAAEQGLQAESVSDPREPGDLPLVSADRPLLSARHVIVAGPSPTTPDMTIAQPKLVASLAPPPDLSARAPSEFSLGTGVPPRPVSVEELLDLDQQVDFFLVLGQEQAAIELLLSHVRSTGGTNALPYFKLLEIYSQKGDEEAYERTRERFNQRFNAFAPAVGVDLTTGRGLDDYPDVVVRLQRAWPQPLRAVAELESLLLRRADLEPFDLPAYRDILMLHALVRDLPTGALPAATTLSPKPMLAPRPELAPSNPSSMTTADGEVDLLLPLDDGPLEITVPHTQVSERASAQAMLADWVFTRATQPRAPADDPTAVFATLATDRAASAPTLDLDLSDFAPAPREFTRPAAFTDIDQRRDSRLSDLGALDEDDRLPTASRR